MMEKDKDKVKPFLKPISSLVKLNLKKLKKGVNNDKKF